MVKRSTLVYYAGNTEYSHVIATISLQGLRLPSFKVVLVLSIEKSLWEESVCLGFFLEPQSAKLGIILSTEKENFGTESLNVSAWNCSKT